MRYNVAMDALLGERRSLAARIAEQREQLERIRALAGDLAEHLERDERALEEIDCVLGKAPQLRLEDTDVRLRGRRLEEVAIAILEDERGPDAEVHYREWFEFLRARGHLVSGKEPLDTFLAQINRSRSVERVGRRSGIYRLRRAA